jgi:HPt (histidine-containing phosphotransfer) domain-containing protein
VTDPVRTFFLEEAAECLDVLRGALSSGGDRRVVHAAARRLRGSAQMARYGALAREAGALEAALREGPGGASPSSDPASPELERRLRSLEEGLDAVRDGTMQQDPRKEEPMDTAVATERVVPIETLEYSPAAALKRALDLRDALEAAIVEDRPTGPILDELFDLIRLAGA